MRRLLLALVLWSGTAGAETYRVDHMSMTGHACTEPDVWWRESWHVRVTPDDVLLGDLPSEKSMSNGRTHWGWFRQGDGFTIVIVVTPGAGGRADVKVFMIYRRGAVECVERWIGVGEHV